MIIEVDELLKVGGQYLLPAAALLRALYAGARGNFPEGFGQILAASLVAGLTALANGENQEITVGWAVGQIIGNTVFMAGLLSFIMVYLLRQPDRGRWVDGIVGAVIGVIAWLFWVGLLENEWGWWTVIPTAAAGAAAFIVLRLALRQLYRLVRIATYLLIVGVILMIGAGAFLLLQSLTQNAPAAEAYFWLRSVS